MTVPIPRLGMDKKGGVPKISAGWLEAASSSYLFKFFFGLAPLEKVKVNCSMPRDSREANLFTSPSVGRIMNMDLPRAKVPPTKFLWRKILPGGVYWNRNSHPKTFGARI